MRQFVCGFKDQAHLDYVCLLKKSLYGLQQTPRAWYQWFANFVSTIGFLPSKSDHSLFIYNKGADLAYILLYVEDIILTASFDKLHQLIMSLLTSEFAMKDLGPLSYFLALQLQDLKVGYFFVNKSMPHKFLNGLA